MKPLSLEDLRLLVAEHEGPCVTLTMPTHVDPRAAAQDPVLYRDLLRKAERALDLPPAAREELLRPLRDLDGPDLWSVPAGGLAVFRARDVAVFYRTTDPLPEEVVVDRRFHVRALLPSLRAGTRYLLLTLSQNHVALFMGTLRDLVPVHVPSLPTSIAEALGPEWRDRLVTGHSHGKGPLTFHGQGEPSDDARSDAVRFFRRVDEALWPVLRDADLPLILAGVEHYHPLFRQVSRYRQIVDEGVHGNVERETPDRLLARVRPVAERLARAREEEAVAEHERHRRHGRALTSLEAIAYAAIRGRVRRLLLAEGAKVLGEIDPETGGLTRRFDHRDALEDLTEQVLIRGGEVVTLPRARMPEESVVAATLRW